MSDLAGVDEKKGLYYFTPDATPLERHLDRMPLRGKYLLVHGTGDDNVHFQNSTAWVDAMIKTNKDYQTLYYCNHSICGSNTSLHLYRQMSHFVLQNLQGGKP